MADPIPDGTLSVSGNQLTIDPAADLAVGDAYAVQIGGTVVEDASGNAFAGIADTTTWSFTTATGSSTSKLLDISHDGTAVDEANPFDTTILSQGGDWTYTTERGSERGS